MPEIQESGRYLADILCIRLKPAKETGSQCLSIKFEATHVYNPDAKQWAETDLPRHIWGDVWILKKGGAINERAVEDFATATGWNGDIGTVEMDGDKGDLPWQPEQVQILVNWEEYQGKKRLKVAFINPADTDPEAFGGGFQTDSSELVNRMGAAFRALAAAAKAKRAVPAEEPPI